MTPDWELQVRTNAAGGNNLTIYHIPCQSTWRVMQNGRWVCRKCLEGVPNYLIERQYLLSHIARKLT